MAVTFQQVFDAVLPDEPDYAEAAGLGPEALPHLRKIIEGDDPGMAAKAADLVGFIAGPRSPEILLVAARASDPVIRIAAASAARRIDAGAREDLLLALLDDPDLGVRKFALKAVPRTLSPAVRSKVSALSRTEGNPVLRDLSLGIVARATEPGS